MRFAWVDIETTGLNPEQDLLLEIGMVVTDEHLNVLDSITAINGEVDADYAHRCANEYVRDMHAASGLWRDLQVANATAAPWQDSVDGLRSFIDRYFDEPPPMCGSSVHFDRSFIAFDLPSLIEKFSHRNVDVSTLKELAKVWEPDVYAKRPQVGLAAHRPIPDLLASIAELDHYVVSDFIRPTRLTGET